ncbi:MAG: alpha/beta fold hydrolase [Gemmatimonadota bacterium]
MIRTGTLIVAVVSTAAPGLGQEAREVSVAEGYVTAEDGTRLFYKTIGDGPEQIVVPVGLFLEEALGPLANDERRLVFYDPRGRGRSDSPDTLRVSLDHQISDVEAIRSGLGIERMALIGWSGLGMEMVVYAMRHPDRVTRIVQVAPVAPRNTPHNERAYAERERRIDQAALEHLEERSASGEFSEDPAGYCRARSAITRVASFADPERAAEVPDVCGYPNEWADNLGPLFRALMGSFGDYDWRAGLGSLDVPRLVIHGAADAFPVEGSREWVEGHPNARLIVLEDAGHFPFIERPDAFFPAVDAFLDGEWPPEAQDLSSGG